MDNVTYNSKQNWKLDEIVYPEDSNRWEKGIADVVALANYLNSTDIPQLRTAISNIPNTVANKDLSNLSNAGESKFVKRIGDSMTGSLTIAKTGDHVIMQELDLDVNTTPSQTKTGGYLTIADLNNKILSRIYAAQLSSGENITSMQAWSSTDSNQSADISIAISKDGSTKFATAPTPPTHSNNIEIATAGWVRNLMGNVQGVTYLNDKILYWFYTDKPAGVLQVTKTLPIAMASSDYAIEITPVHQPTNSGNISGSWAAIGQTATTFVLFGGWQAAALGYKVLIFGKPAVSR